MNPLLTARGLRVRFGGVVAIAGVNFELAENEFVCIVGPNGAGKSTLLNVLSGTLRPDSGSLRVGEVEMVGRPAHVFCRLGMARKFQGANVFQWLSARDNLVVAGLAAAAHTRRDMPDPDEILGLVKLKPQADTIAETASHGQRQWLEVGMALMCRPKVLLLDEPTAGMTVEGTKDMAALIHGLRDRVALVVIEHDMAFVRALDCRTLVMHQGAIIASGRISALEKDETVRDVYLGRRIGRHASH